LYAPPGKAVGLIPMLLYSRFLQFTVLISVSRTWIQDPVPGSGIGKKSGSGSVMNNLDYIFEGLETIFWGKILKFFDAVPGSGMEKIQIRDGKKSGPGIRNTACYSFHLIRKMSHLMKGQWHGYTWPVLGPKRPNAGHLNGF
jgi:hypothetical protein